MKTIVLLAALTCLIGFAGAQTMSGLGQGYSSSQQAFYNAPTTSTFEPNVQSYWGNYIASQKNLSVIGGTPEMQIWMNHFPLSFDSPLQLKATSFNGSAAASALSITERNTQFLTRDIMRNFDFDSASSSSLNAGSLKAYESTGTPGEDMKGKMLSSSIVSLFGA
jgi:hypothetical protein